MHVVAVVVGAAVAPASGLSVLRRALAPPVAVGPELTAALLLATAGAIALFWVSVKMVAGSREYRQVTAERDVEAATETGDGDAN